MGVWSVSVCWVAIPVIHDFTTLVVSCEKEELTRTVNTSAESVLLYIIDLHCEVVLQCCITAGHNFRCKTKGLAHFFWLLCFNIIHVHPFVCTLLWRFECGGSVGCSKWLLPEAQSKWRIGGGEVGEEPDLRPLVETTSGEAWRISIGLNRTLQGQFSPEWKKRKKVVFFWEKICVCEEQKILFNCDCFSWIIGWTPSSGPEVFKETQRETIGLCFDSGRVINCGREWRYWWTEGVCLFFSETLLINTVTTGADVFLTWILLRWISCGCIQRVISFPQVLIPASVFHMQ